MVIRYLFAALVYFSIKCSLVFGEESLLKFEEDKRKAKVHALVQELSNKSDELQKIAYEDLRDIYIRKRDIPELTSKIGDDADPNIKISLKEIISFIEVRWRMPDKGWTQDLDELRDTYGKAFKDLDSSSIIYEVGYTPDKILELLVWDCPADTKNRTDVKEMILALEPKSLDLWQGWEDIGFIVLLPELEKLNFTLASVSDLTPLEELTSLQELQIMDAPVKDLTPLVALSELKSLRLENTKVTDLTPLKDLPNLKYLYADDGLDLKSLKDSSITIRPANSRLP